MLTEQELSDTFCPQCGGDPILGPDGKAAVEHRLSASGYLHDDMNFRCEDCDNTWTHGVPIGEYEPDHTDELRCDVCFHDPDADEQYYRTHRVELIREPSDDHPGRVQLHLKCPRCFHFTKVQREMDQRGVSLVGFQDITGSVEHEDVTPYGWTE